jgi:hypothetical protein
LRALRANLRILDVTEVKTVPYVPLSHPFVERLIGTIRREFLDCVPFWTTRDLERKLASFKDYYNQQRVHRGLDGAIPDNLLHYDSRMSIYCIYSGYRREIPQMPTVEGIQQLFSASQAYDTSKPTCNAPGEVSTMRRVEIVPGRQRGSRFLPQLPVFTTLPGIEKYISY